MLGKIRENRTKTNRCHVMFLDWKIKKGAVNRTVKKFISAVKYSSVSAKISYQMSFQILAALCLASRCIQIPISIVQKEK